MSNEKMIFLKATSKPEKKIKKSVQSLPKTGANKPSCKPLKACEELKPLSGEEFRLIKLMRSSHYQICNRDMTIVISWIPYNKTNEGKYLYTTPKYSKIISYDDVIKLLQSKKFSAEKKVKIYYDSSVIINNIKPKKLFLK